MPESLSHHQFMIIASSFHQESTPAQEEQNEYEYPNGLGLYEFLTRRADFLQVREVPKSPLPSQPLVGLGLGSLTDGAIRPSSSITRLKDEPQGVAGDPDMPAVDVCHAEHSSPRTSHSIYLFHTFKRLTHVIIILYLQMSMFLLVNALPELSPREFFRACSPCSHGYP